MIIPSDQRRLFCWGGGVSDRAASGIVRVWLFMMGAYPRNGHCSHHQQKGGQQIPAEKMALFFMMLLHSSSRRRHECQG